MVLVRTRGEPLALVAPIAGAVRRADPALALFDVQTMEARARGSWSKHTFQTGLFVVIGVIALALAVTGVYAVTSYYVASRTREIGVRMALGASSLAVARAAMAQTTRLALTGGTIGVLGAVALSRIIGATYTNESARSRCLRRSGRRADSRGHRGELFPAATRAPGQSCRGAPQRIAERSADSRLSESGGEHLGASAVITCRIQCGTISRPQRLGSLPAGAAAPARSSCAIHFGVQQLRSPDAGGTSPEGRSGHDDTNRWRRTSHRSTSGTSSRRNPNARSAPAASGRRRTLLTTDRVGPHTTAPWQRLQRAVNGRLRGRNPEPQPPWTGNTLMAASRPNR